MAAEVSGPVPAALDDVGAMRRLAERAYLIYVPRIGRKPAPMIADFASHVARDEAYVLRAGADLAGYIVTFAKDDAQFIENVAIDPAFQGQRLGGRLAQFAEAEAFRAGLTKLRLYTNARMIENRDFYLGLGYRIIGRIREAGFDRIYFEKNLETS